MSDPHISLNELARDVSKVDLLSLQVLRRTWLDLSALEKRIAIRLIGAAPSPEDPTPVPRLLTVKQVAEILNVKTSWVHEAARSKVLPSVKVGRYVRFNEPDVLTYRAKGGK